MIIAFIFSMMLGSSDSLLSKENSTGPFDDAVSVAVDAKDNIYVLDAGNNEIVKFDNKLNFLKRNGKQGWAEGQFDRPAFIDASSGLDLFISDSKNYRIQRLDLEMNFISALTTNADDFPLELKYRTPKASIVLNSNELYVIDGDNNRIVVYRDGKNPSFVFGDARSGKGQLGNPVKIMRDGKNYIYVLDKEQKLIIRYDNLGNYAGKITVPKLETFTIRNDLVYLYDGSAVHIYNPELNSITGKKIISSGKSKLKVRDIVVLSEEKYLLLGKNELSLWRENIK